MRPILFLSILLFISCETSRKLDAQKVIDQAIQSAGFSGVEDKVIEFDFRDKHYTLLRSGNSYTYTRSFQDSLGFVEDVLINSTEFSRTVEGTPVELDDEWSGKYANSVNSVLYFVQVPLTLNDPAAIKAYQGEKEINGKIYHEVQVRFTEDNGGKDFEDVFLYWFEKETYSLDYLAYSYITDGGGVRFREAFNKQVVAGISFQDYINYKPKEKTTPLEEMLGLYLDRELIELSKIENKNIRVTIN